MRDGNQKYDAEFRAGALSLLARGDRTLRQVARDLGVNFHTLRYWKHEDSMKRKKQKSSSTAAQPPIAETPEEEVLRLRAEMAALERKIAQLEMDREILKKAAAFFAREPK